MMSASADMRLFNDAGARKYLCGKELARFLAAARKTEPATHALCVLLALTGCRISEALALTYARLDPETGRVVFQTLKRRRVSYRAVPIPADLMGALRKLGNPSAPHLPLWNWCRQTGWRRIKAVMDAAGIAGPHAMPKGLRHGFGVANAEENVPMATTQRWLGHARLETTAIYQHATGKEERTFARRLWHAVR